MTKLIIIGAVVFLVLVICGIVWARARRRSRDEARRALEAARSSYSSYSGSSYSSRSPEPRTSGSRLAG